MTIWWNPNSESDLAGYTVYRQETDPNTQQTSWEVIGTAVPGSVGYMDPNRSTGATYTYAVSAFDADAISAMSASVSSRPKVSAPPPPEASNATQGIDIWGGGWVTFDFGGATGYTGPPNYTKFHVYRKRQGLPADQWTLVYSSYTSGEFWSPVYDRCGVTEYVIGAETWIAGHAEETQDSDVLRSLALLEPKPPIVSTQGPNLRIDADGFVGCGWGGTDYAVYRWKLVRKEPDGTQTEFDFDPDGVTTLETLKPTNPEEWAFALKAEMIDLYATTDPNFPVVFDSYMSQDVCVDSHGDIDPNDEACPDLDNSQTQIPPPIVQWQEPCGTGCSGGGGSESDWQELPMRMKACLNRICRAALDLPEPKEATPGEAGWSVAWRHRGEKERPDGQEVASATTSGPVQGSVPTWDVSERATRASLAADGVALHEGWRWTHYAPGLPDSSPQPGTSPARLLPPDATEPSLSRRAGGGFPRIVPQAGAGSSEPMLAGGIPVPLLQVNGSATKQFKWTFFHSDHLGSVRVITKEDGTAAWKGKFFPYGEEMPESTGTTQAKFFANHRLEGGFDLYPMRARFHSRTCARFISVDPSGANPKNVTSWNKYGYALDNPIAYLDSTGHYAVFFLGSWQKTTSSPDNAGLLQVAGALADTGIGHSVINGPTGLIFWGKNSIASAGLSEFGRAAPGDSVRAIAGFSRGAHAAIAAASKLARVDLLVTIDPELTSHIEIPSSVRLAVNITNNDGWATAASPDTTVINILVPDGIGHSGVDDFKGVVEFVKALVEAVHNGSISREDALDLAHKNGLTEDTDPAGGGWVYGNGSASGGGTFGAGVWRSLIGSQAAYISSQNNAAMSPQHGSGPRIFHVIGD